MLSRLAAQLNNAYSELHKMWCEAEAVGQFMHALPPLRSIYTTLGLWTFASSLQCIVPSCFLPVSLASAYATCLLGPRAVQVAVGLHFYAYSCAPLAARQAIGGSPPPDDFLHGFRIFSCSTAAARMPGRGLGVGVPVDHHRAPCSSWPAFGFIGATRLRFWAHVGPSPFRLAVLPQQGGVPSTAPAAAAPPSAPGTWDRNR